MLQLNGGSSTAAIATPAELRRQLTQAQTALAESRQHAQQFEQQLSELRANTERLQRDKASLKTELATLRRDLGGVSTDILAELNSASAGGSQVRLLGGTITAAEVLARWERLSEVERARDEALQSLDRAQRAAQRKERQWELEKQQLQVWCGGDKAWVEGAAGGGGGYIWTRKAAEQGFIANITECVSSLALHAVACSCTTPPLDEAC
jgi:hypothetical protein